MIYNQNTIKKVDFLSITPEIFQKKYQKPGIPVIITGLVKDADWNLDYLSKNLGDRKFFARFYGKDRYQQDKRQWKSVGSGVTTKSVSFNEYATWLRNGKAREQDIYLAKCSLQNTSLSSLEYLANIGDKLAFARPMSDFNLWAGPSGHTEPLHYDTLDGTLIHLHGAKKVILFPPSQTNNLYPFPLSLHLRYGLKLRSWFSQVYPTKPDFQAFPKLKEALKYKQEMILNRGEILYIPAGWWHEITGLGDELVCSVNRFWSVNPRQRLLLSWFAWRSYLGILFSLPHTFFNLAIASIDQHRKEKITQILQMF